MPYIPHSFTNTGPVPFVADINKNRDPVYPEKKFLSAILARAVIDYLGGAGADAKRVAERTARGWIFKKQKKKKEFSFDWVCEHLELDPESFKTYLLRLESSPEKKELVARFRSLI